MCKGWCLRSTQEQTRLKKDARVKLAARRSNAHIPHLELRVNGTASGEQGDRRARTTWRGTPKDRQVNQLDPPRLRDADGASAREV